MGRIRTAKSPQIQVADPWKPLPQYILDPLEMVAIGLKLGPVKWDKARLAARERGINTVMAIIGNAEIRTEMRPPAEMRPPEAWLREFVKPKYLAKAREYVTK